MKFKVEIAVKFIDKTEVLNNLNSLLIAITLFVGRILNVGTCFPDSHRRENIISCRAIVDRVVIVIDVQVRTSVVEIDNYDRNIILL